MTKCKKLHPHLKLEPRIDTTTIVNTIVRTIEPTTYNYNTYRERTIDNYSNTLENRRETYRGYSC